MTDKPEIKQELKKGTRNDGDPKLRTEVIEDLDVPAEDADVLKGASTHPMCTANVRQA